MEIAPALVPELCDYQFSHDMDAEIANFERSVGGAALPSYYQADPDQGTAIGRFQRSTIV